MLFDKEGNLVPEQAKIPERLEARDLQCLSPGDIVKVDASALFADEEGKAWLYGDYPIDGIPQYYEPQGEDIYVMRFFEGYAVNFAMISRPPDTITKINLCELFDDENMDATKLIPVIALINTKKEHEIISEYYKEKFNCLPEQKLTPVKRKSTATKDKKEGSDNKTEQATTPRSSDPVSE